MKLNTTKSYKRQLMKKPNELFGQQYLLLYLKYYNRTYYTSFIFFLYFSCYLLLYVIQIYYDILKV